MSDPAAVKIAGLSEHRFIIHITIEPAREERQVPLNRSETRIRGFVGPSGIFLRVAACSDSPITRPALPLTPGGFVRSSQKLALDINRRNVPGWGMAGFEHTIGGVGFGNDLTVVQDADRFCGSFEARRSRIVPY